MAFPGDRPTSTSRSSVPKPDVAPEAEIVEEDEEQSLPQPEEQAAKLRFDEDEGTLAAGRAAVLHHAKLAPSRPGVIACSILAATCFMSAKRKTSQSA